MPFRPSQRINALPPYLFVEIDRKKAAAIEAGRDVINFGIGDPDLPTPGFVVERLARAAADTSTHRYPSGVGSPAFRKGVANFMRRRYGVSLDPNGEILALIGSKEGIGHLPLAVINPGDRVLAPDPAYPVYHSGTIFAGGQHVVLPLDPERGWLPDFDKVPTEAARGAALMFLNYPNNPTGACAPLEFFERAVAFARRNDLLLAHDAAYNEMYYGAEPPPSVLQVPGAKDVAIEFHSASKSFNMTGWRIGFAAGNRDVLAALAKIKANMDSGQFAAVQEAAVAAFDQYDCEELRRNRKTYGRRCRALAAALSEIGFAAGEPQATFYVWAKAPAGYDGMAVVNKLLDEAAIVCVPGAGFGARGRDFVRFAMTVPQERVETAVARMRDLEW